MQTKPLSILIADDDLEDIELMKHTILSLAPQALVNHVLNGKEVIDLLSGCSDNELPHLMILDYNMPRMTGLEVLSMLNAEKRYSKIIKLILSTSASKIHIKQCLVNGARDYFIKPGNIKELEMLTRKMLALSLQADPI